MNRFSIPSIHPKNFATAKASLSQKWYIQYYYYHEGKRTLKIVYGKINTYKTLLDRRKSAITSRDELHNVLKEGWNPITKTNPAKPKINTFIAAITHAFARLQIEPTTRMDMKSCLKYITASTTELGLQFVQIDELKRKHLIAILEGCKKPPKRYNKYRSYLSMLYEELVQLELVEYNPVTAIKRKKVTVELKRILTPAERELINREIKPKHYNFWRFIVIFFHSGCRLTELMSLKLQDVNIAKQELTIIVKKGPQAKTMIRPIKLVALPFWKELQGLPADYVFSEGLQPGPSRIRTEQIKRRWHVHVQIALGINAGFYSLKHTNTTEVTALQGNIIAAKLNGHINTLMVDTVYNVNHLLDEIELVKKLGNEF